MQELQTQIAETQTLKSEGAACVSDYQSQLAAIQELHVSCKNEADEMRQLLESREGELSKMISSLQIAAAQIAALDGRERSPSEVDNEVRICSSCCVHHLLTNTHTAVTV